MKDFILSFTKNPSGFIIATSSGEHLSLALHAFPPLPTAELGRWLYQQIFSGPILTRYQADAPDRLLLYLPFDLLDWPWQMLHDGFQPLTLRHPIVLLPAEQQNDPASSLLLTDGPLRILLTLALDEEHAALGATIEQVIDEFEQKHAGRVIVRKESGKLDTRRLFQVFKGALVPFHLWHHVGPCSTDFTLKLADADLGPSNLNALLALQRGLRSFVLSTQQTKPAPSALSQLNTLFTLCQSVLPTSTSDPSLLQGFYDHLLTHDLAVASTLAQLEKYLDASANAEWSPLTLLARTPRLHLGAPQRAQMFVKRRGHNQFLTPENSVKILILKANPRYKSQEKERLRIDQEMREITSAMSENRRFFDRREEGAVRISDFSRYLASHQPGLLHFSGHAFESGSLAFEKYVTIDEFKAQARLYAGLVAEPDLIPFEVVASILAEYKKTLRCVVLNACYTEPLAEAICKQIDCAIGMRGAINDSYAISFSYGLYQALASGDSVGEAFRKACNEVALRNRTDQTQIFQLKSKLGVNPDDIFFVQTQGGNL